ITYCRVFVTRQTADAHRRIFAEIDRIVQQDTDQHGGQAKGIGLHLQTLSRSTSLQGKRDLHEPHRLLSDLSPYEHLHRILRLCTVHVYRNIRQCSVSEEVRNLMRSLICMEHTSWDETLQIIEEKGGKAGKGVIVVPDWVKDKRRSGFAFQGICWERSMIPEDIWKAGDATSNVVESAHSDVNREGINCTLVGGIRKGHSYDTMKLKTLQTMEMVGTRPSYRSGHISENIEKAVKRKFTSHHNKLQAEDAKIENFNKKMKQSQDALAKQIAKGSTSSKTHQKTKATYDKLLASKASLPSGSGKVHPM
ncbi:hypothetical protein H0H93_009153, partial [Arthromyces matolae]